MIFFKNEKKNYKSIRPFSLVYYLRFIYKKKSRSSDLDIIVEGEEFLENCRIVFFESRSSLHVSGSLVQFQSRRRPPNIPGALIVIDVECVQLKNRKFEPFAVRLNALNRYRLWQIQHSIPELLFSVTSRSCETFQQRTRLHLILRYWQFRYIFHQLRVIVQCYRMRIQPLWSARDCCKNIIVINWISNFFIRRFYFYVIVAICRHEFRIFACFLNDFSCRWHEFFAPTFFSL